MRTMVTLACTDCKRRNYTTNKNKANNPERMELKNYSLGVRAMLVIFGIVLWAVDLGVVAVLSAYAELGA